MKMKLRENPAVKALAFTAAVAAFAATAILGWYQLANYDALWDPDYNEGDGYTIYYLERRDEQDIVGLLNLYELRDAGTDLSVYQEQEIVRLEDELSAQSTNLRWQLLAPDKTVLHGNTQESLPARALGLYWTYYEPLDLGAYAYPVEDDAWARLAASAVNVDDATNAVYTDDWQRLLEL